MGWKQTFQKKMKAAGMENDIPAANRNADSGGWQDKFRSKMEAAGMGGDIIRTGGRTAADVAPSTYKPDTSMLVTPGVPAGNTTSAAGKYNVGQGLAKAGQMGLTQIAKVGSSAGAWIENLLGDFAREGSNGYWDPDTSNWLFNRWNRAIDAEAQGVQQRYAENTARGGKAAQVFEDLGAATVAAVPQAIAALLTGGASTAAQAGALAENAAASSGLVNTISRSMRAMAKDPNFQLSFAQVFGPGYEQAKADGADDFRASVYAIGNGLMNAAVEVGGGIQTLPRELQNGGNAWKTWVDAMLDEGKEEVVQGVIERATQNAVYGRDNPLVGIGNGAIFDPAAAAEEFAGGAVVGGILGGGQVGVNTLANRAAYNAARAQYDRDVRQNTAREMDGRTAEAVEAVTRGETITGNQAAAIARDPVAVETLEASTGVKLDTEKPISQLKREIIALASRETMQEQTQRTTAIPQTQKRAQKAVGGFMEAGQRAYQQVRETSGSGAEVYAGFSAMYNAGLNGVEAEKAKGKYAAMLTPEQRYTAYNAGLEDARAQVARENADIASVTTTAGAGLADNAYSRYIIAKDKGAASALNTIGKKLGVRIEFVDSIMDGQANGQYIREKNLIQIAADSTNPIYEVAGHEVTHRMQDLSPDEYRAFRQAAIEYRMRENGADTETEVVQRYMEAAERAGVTLTQDEVMDEISADFAGRMIEDTDLFAQFAKDNRTAAQKLLDGLKEFIAKVKAMFTGKARDNAAMDAYGKTFEELEDIAQKWQAAFDAAERQAEKTKTAAGEGDGAKYQIKRFPNGMKYVQADRQVLFGNDPKAWSEQLENYINGKIRNHEDVRLIAEDGDVLLLTSKSAGKLSSIYDNNGRTMDEKAFERKANAAAHIDELIKVSERGGKTVLDFGGRHGDMAKDGWNYRTAYFMDFDGKYYRTRISVALGKDGSIVYNIGEMQERSTPQINGSSGNSGAQRGNASANSIPTEGGNVKPKFSLKATDSTGRKLSEQQQEYFKDSKVRDAEGRLMPLYHQTSVEFTVFDTRHKGAGTGDNETPFGVFLKSSSRDIGVNGSRQMELYADIKNPLQVHDRSELVSQLAEMSSEYAALKNRSDVIDKEYNQKFEKAKKDFVDFITEWRRQNPTASRSALYEVDEFNKVFDAEDSLVEEWGKAKDDLALQAKEAITSALRNNGYDGVIISEDSGSFGRTTDAYIALDARQVKNVDNLTPTSNPDIRYQLRSTADIEQEVRDLKRERTVLASRNRALEQRVQELKGEMRISKEPSVVLRDVKKLGRETIRKYGSDVEYGDIQADMEALGKAVMKKDVSMADLMPYARNAATAIVDNTTELTEHGAELLEIKDYLKRQKILFNGEMDHYNEFRKRYMGTLKLNKSEGLPVDIMYEEMTEMFGEGYFPSDVYTEADKLQQIADVLDSMDSIYENPFDSYRDAAIQEIANDIIDGMISDQVRQKKTFADRRELEKQEAVGRVREMLTKEREKRRDMVKRMRREYSEKTQKGREKRYAAEMRAKIARHTGPLSEKLLRPTDKKHIPDELRVVVADLLRNINLESAYSYDENGRLRKNAGGDPTRRTQEAVKLKKAYEDIIAREGNMVVDPDLLDSGGLLDSLAALGGKRIADMNVTELETVWNAVRAIEATLTSYDRTLANQKYARTSEWADSLMMGSMSRKRRNRKISLDMADPYTFFSAYGDGGMQVYRTLRNAQDREHVMLTELREAAKKFLDADVYKNRFERHTFTTSRGVELTLTNEQIMNLYNLAKRGEQAMNHLMVGGIVQPEIKRDGKLKAIPRGTENILLTLEDVRAITSVLTPEQIKVADGLQKLASTKLAEWGNEASMAVYGYRKFMETHYWPIKTAKEATASSVEKGPDIAREIKNMGSAKALTPNASNALDIGGVYDVFAQNASDMIKYATLLAPMEDINRLYNYRYRDSMGNLTGKNVRQVLSGVYGDAAQSYWRNLMRDVQNGVVKNASATTRAVERIVGNTKGAAVGANLRVVIQQPTAYFRAAVVLDPENMAKGLGNGVTKGNGWDKARKWAPIAGIKDTSGFDQGSRYTIAREVYGTDGSFMSWLSDKSMSLAGKADAVTWGKIWNACEWQVASETNLEVGSNAYYQQVADVFTDVIDQTQVVDGIMQRTQIMRDSDALTRQATSFMGEPLKSLNILMRSYDAWVYETNPQKRSKALKQLKRAVGALLVTDVVNALAQSIVDGLRDDDKDKKYWERVLEAFTGITGEEKDFGEAVKNITLQGNVKGNITLVGRIPYAKDIISILQGYTVDRMDAGAVDDIVRATKSMISSANGQGKKTAAYNVKQFLTVVSKIFGVSVANLGRDTWAIARSIASETGNVRLMFEMEKAIYRMDKSAGNRKTWCELLYRAQKERDTETARLIYREMLAHGYEETDVRQGVETIMKQEQGVNSVKELRNRWMAP
jgi:hypothetical protein